MRDPFEINYRFDLIRWRRRLNSLISNKKPISENLKILKQEIINTKNSAFAYFFAKDFLQDEEEMCLIPIVNEDYKYIYLFAKDIKNIDIYLLQQLIINSNRINYISKFACFVEGANINLFQKIILEHKNIKAYYTFIKHAKSADISLFKDLILKSNKPRYVYELAKRLTNDDDLKKAQEVILNCNSFIYLKLYAQNIKSADLSKFDKLIIKRKNKEEIIAFAGAVKKSRLKNYISFT